MPAAFGLYPKPVPENGGAVDDEPVGVARLDRRVEAQQLQPRNRWSAGHLAVPYNPSAFALTMAVCHGYYATDMVKRIGNSCVWDKLDQLPACDWVDDRVYRTFSRKSRVAVAIQILKQTMWSDHGGSVGGAAEDLFDYVVGDALRLVVGAADFGLRLGAAPRVARKQHERDADQAEQGQHAQTQSRAPHPRRFFFVFPSKCDMKHTLPVLFTSIHHSSCSSPKGDTLPCRLPARLGLF